MGRTTRSAARAGVWVALAAILVLGACRRATPGASGRLPEGFEPPPSGYTLRLPTNWSAGDRRSVAVEVSVARERGDSRASARIAGLDAEVEVLERRPDGFVLSVTSRIAEMPDVQADLPGGEGAAGAEAARELFAEVGKAMGEDRLLILTRASSPGGS
jgi:hypothetical protein